MTLRTIAHSATPDAIRILFDGPVDPHHLEALQDPRHYQVLAESLAPVPLTGTPPVTFDPQTRVATLHGAMSGTLLVRVLQPIMGNADSPFAEVTVPSPSAPASGPALGSPDAPLNVRFGASGLSDDARDALRTQRDAFSYPMLTEDIGGARPAGGGRARGGGGSAGSLSALVSQTLGDVLGWKARVDDPAAFEGALNASFEIDEADGVSTWKWTPRTYAVQSDLSGGISGAQASLYKRAVEALEQSLPLLDGLYPLDPRADTDNIAALKAVVRTQLSQLVGELATAGGPGEARVNSYFGLLLTRNGSFQTGSGALLTSEPDDLGGTLGELRDQLGLRGSQNFVNTIEDEQDLTNYRILADYVTGLAQTWLNNRHFFGFGRGPRFLGTQLVPLSRQLSVISEAVDELRFALDSVFIGASERQTLQLDFGTPSDGMFAEDFLQWIQNFVDDEAPVYVQQGGKFGIGNSLMPIAQRLLGMARQLRGQRGLPRGFYTSRVERAIESLVSELAQLVALSRPVGADFAAAAAAPALLVAPGALEFGPESSLARLSLINAGAQDLVVEGSFSSAGFGFTSGDATTPQLSSLHLRAGRTRDVFVRDLSSGGTGTAASARTPDAALFTFRLADGTGPTERVSVPLRLVDETF